MTITTDELARLRAVAEAATPGPWDWVGKIFETMDEAKEWLGQMMDYAPDNLFIHGVGHMLDGSHVPDGIDDVWAWVMPALTGNGPTAESNAKYLTAFDPPTALALLAELEQARAQLAQARQLMRRWWERAEELRPSSRISAQGEADALQACGNDLAVVLAPTVAAPSELEQARARIRELESLLNAEQAEAEAAGDAHQALAPPPRGWGRWRAGQG